MLKAEDLVLGGKYTPHNKSEGFCGLYESKAWKRARRIGQSYLYYTGFDEHNCHMFNDTDTLNDGDFFLPSDVTPYMEVNIGKLTAVEWLIESLKRYLPSIHMEGLEDVFEQARTLEKTNLRKEEAAGYWKGWEGYSEALY